MPHLRALVAVTVLTAVASPAYARTPERPPSAKPAAVLVAKPATVDFKSKRVGTENYTSGTKIRQQQVRGPSGRHRRATTRTTSASV